MRIWWSLEPDAGWRERLRGRGWWLALVAGIHLVVTAITIRWWALVWAVFLAAWVTLGAMWARKFGPAWSRSLNARKVRKAARDGALQIAREDRHRRGLANWGASAREGLRLAGFALIVGILLAAMFVLMGARVQDSGRNEGFPILAMTLGMLAMPVAAIPWAASWLPKESRIKVKRSDTGGTDELDSMWLLRALAPAALFSSLYSLARMIHEDSAIIQYVIEGSFVVAGIILIGTTAAITTTVLDILGRERMYTRLEQDLKPELVARYDE